jgi:hypothetical protein
MSGATYAEFPHQSIFVIDIYMNIGPTGISAYNTMSEHQNIGLSPVPGIVLAVCQSPSAARHLSRRLPLFSCRQRQGGPYYYRSEQGG